MISAARWHRKGTPVVYCADHPATALLEKLVHIDLEDMPSGYTLLSIEVPDMASYRIEVSNLPREWMTDMETTQDFGDTSPRERRTPCRLGPVGARPLRVERPSQPSACRRVGLHDHRFRHAALRPALDPLGASNFPFPVKPPIQFPRRRPLQDRAGVDRIGVHAFDQRRDAVEAPLRADEAVEGDQRRPRRRGRRKNRTGTSRAAARRRRRSAGGRSSRRRRGALPSGRRKRTA